jgi:hypothetical protein
MRSERDSWRRKVGNWQKGIDQSNQGLEGSKVSAIDLVGERPPFQPSQEYKARITIEALHLGDVLTRDTLSTRKRARVESHLQNLQSILDSLGSISLG